MIELCNDKKKKLENKKKNIEFRRKHLITSSRARKKYTARAIAIAAVSIVAAVVVAAAKMECERVWHSIAMKITGEKNV